jgi:hypothetical protein
MSGPIRVDPDPVPEGDTGALDLHHEHDPVRDQHEIDLGRELVVVLRQVQRVKRCAWDLRIPEQAEDTPFRAGDATHVPQVARNHSHSVGPPTYRPTTGSEPTQRSWRATI